MSSQSDALSKVLTATDKDGSFRVSNALTSYPQLGEDSNSLAQLVFEEFCSRIDSGENRHAVIQDLTSKYPASKEQFNILLSLDSELSGIFETSYQAELQWPMPGENRCGINFIEVIAVGHNSKVYLATQPSLSDRRVIVKVSLSLEREAQILSKLEHKRIVNILSIHQDEVTKLRLIAMPFESKITLRETLSPSKTQFEKLESTDWRNSIFQIRNVTTESGNNERSWISTYGRTVAEQELCRIGCEVAEALTFSHKKHIIHCDLKPANILLLPDGSAKLMDFSLSTTTSPTITELLKCGGTPAYMAPELFTALQSPESLDERADIFSLGATLFHCLTGQLPFSDDEEHSNSSSTLRQLSLSKRDQDRPARILSSTGVSAELAGILVRCLRHSADERYASAAELHHDLRNFLTRKQQLRSRRRAFINAGLVAGLCSTVAAVTAWAVFPEELEFDDVIRLSDSQKFEEAIQHCNRQISNKKEVDDSEWVALRAYCLQKLDKHDLAFQDLDTLKNQTQTGELLASVAYSAGSCRLKPQFVLELYKRGKSAGFENVACLNNQAVAYMLIGDLQQASRLLTLAMRIQPKNRVILFNAAFLNLKKVVRESNEEHLLRPKLELIEKAIAVDSPKVNESLFYRDAALVYAHDFENSKSEKSLTRCVELLKLAVAKGTTKEQLLQVLPRTLVSQNESIMNVVDSADNGISEERSTRLLDPLAGNRSSRAWIDQVLTKSRLKKGAG